MAFAKVGVVVGEVIGVREGRFRVRVIGEVLIDVAFAKVDLS